jgi:hypothetical protein
MDGIHETNMGTIGRFYGYHRVGVTARCARKSACPVLSLPALFYPWYIYCESAAKPSALCTNLLCHISAAVVDLECSQKAPP